MAQLNQIPRVAIGEPREVICEFSVGATGAPTLVAANSKGITSITRNSTGRYTVKLDKTYNRLCFFAAQCIAATGVPAAPHVFQVSDTVATAATRGVVFQTNAGSGTSGALVATDPASGEVVRVRLFLKDTSA